jgi:metal transporter CNNM
VALLIVTMSGLFSGLTMGVVGLDATTLEILSRAGTDVQKRQARRLQWFVSPKGYHWSVTTLLVSNALMMEALPIFVDKIGGPGVSIAVSAALVLLVGEVVPSAVFTGPNQLAIASLLAPVLTFLIFITAPVSYPISKGLDWLLGAEETRTRFRRTELAEFMRLQVHRGHEGDKKPLMAAAPRGNYSSFSSTATPHAPPPHGGGGPLSAEGGYQARPAVPAAHEAGAHGAGESHGAADDDLSPAEVQILTSALGMTKKVAAQRMTPLGRTFMLSSSAPLDAPLWRDITQSGHARIPIFDPAVGRARVVGLFVPKLLLQVDVERPVAVDTLTHIKPPFVYESTHLLDILDILRAGKTHLAIVVKDADAEAADDDEEWDDVSKHTAVGVITFEDVLEELIGDKLGDERQILVGEDTAGRFMRPSARKLKKHAAGAGAAAAVPAPHALPRGTAAAPATPAKAHAAAKAPKTPASATGQPRRSAAKHTPALDDDYDDDASGDLGEGHV